MQTTKALRKSDQQMTAYKKTRATKSGSNVYKSDLKSNSNLEMNIKIYDSEQFKTKKFYDIK